MSTVKEEEIMDNSIRTTNIDPDFAYWIDKGRERVFSLAAGNRIATLAPRIMEIGMAKVLAAADALGSDVDSNRSFCLFAPDGTVSYNPIRTKRGFSYGCVLQLDFDGLIGTNNSMPNGCGFSMYEVINPPDDAELVNYLSDAQMRLGQDQLSQLGKGNHFAGVYRVLDPLSGEDTLRRFVVIHCSGHVGGNRLYHPGTWLEDYPGYYNVPTSHGSVTLLEDEAKLQYLKQYKETDTANSTNRDLTMKEIFDGYYDWKKLQEITHQGLKADGSQHIIGSQIHEGLVPIAFNPEEGLIGVKTTRNLASEFIQGWSEGDRVDTLGLRKDMSQLNFTPHGGGYEFKRPLEKVQIKLNREGIASFTAKISGEEAMKFTYFREIRDSMTFRRKAPVIQQMTRANLATIEYEMPCLMQIYPLVSIPGGSH
ncbi:MAG: hypothetical protein ACXAE3_05105 [Candidatus Kariarchaeaceae archaeon]|jgi:hypothetical protein